MPGRLLFSQKITRSAPSQPQIHALRPDLGAELPALAREVVGLRVNEQDAERHTPWLQARLDSLGIFSLRDYARLLARQDEAGRDEREHLSRQLTTGETYFFRDHGQFELLARKILPELLASRAHTRRLRLWSAGCASGEEAYSLAILLGELVPDDAAWDIQILGTDINSAALGRARTGLYSEWSFRALDPGRKAAHFREEGRHWRISEGLRARVRFEQLDLVRDALPQPARGLGDVDLILCRNVFIYMTAEATALVSGRLSATLAEGGYLVTGHGELLGHHTPGLHPRIFSQAVVLQKSSAESVIPAWTAPAPGPAQPIDRATPRPTPRKSVARPAPKAGRSSHAPAPTPGERGQRLLKEAWRLADQGHTQAAERACGLAIEATPLDPWPYYLLAQLAQERGDARAARAQLDRVVYLDPHCIAAYLELAALQDAGRPPNRSRPLLETARRLLAALPPQAPVPPYQNSTAADVLAFVERLLSGDVQLANASGPSAVNRS